MEGDRVFHLQLTINKLQEELKLYRNGGNYQELVDLVAEKEAEVERLQSSVADKHENLKKLAKKGAEVLARCDALQTECDSLRTQFAVVDKENKQMTSSMNELRTAHASASALCNEKTSTIDFLETELAVRNDSIDKLQARCAILVTEKNEKIKEFVSEREEFINDRAVKMKQSKDLLEELERAMRFNTEGNYFHTLDLFFSHDPIITLSIHPSIHQPSVSSDVPFPFE